jgi:BirA family biotin operon repressor/biotin-[acetyl-CoA-carboxylase] ligase
MNSADVDTIQRTLATTWLGRPLRYLPSVGSTQEVAREAALAGAPAGLAVVAGQQTAGKGRAGRAWWSPARGGLYLSLLLRPALPAEHASWVTMCLALGAAEAIEAVCGLRPDLKWPNDLEWQGRKLAGILAETSFVGDRLDHVIAGIGLNVAVDFSPQPELARTAVSLEQACGQAVDASALLVSLLAWTETRLEAAEQGISPLAAWKDRLVTLGRPVDATGLDGRVLSGMAVNVQEDGSLVLRLDDGSRSVVRAMDVTLRSDRPREADPI